jgi:hypothetical protein
MDQAQLIDRVTKELIRRLGLETESPQEKPLLVAGEPGCCEALKGVCAEYLGATEETLDLGRYAGVAIPSLSENQLVLASMGLKYGNESSAMVDALLAGVPVYVIEEGVLWRRALCGTSPLGKHYEACEEKLRLFGAKFVPAAELAKCSSGSESLELSAAKSVVAPPSSGGCADLRGRKVLSEREFQEACAKNGCCEVLVDAKAIVTPLAMDWLRLRGIVVRRCDGGTK